MNTTVIDITSDDPATNQTIPTVISQIPEDQFLATVEKMIADTKAPTMYLVERLFKQYQDLTGNEEDATTSSRKELDYQQKINEVYERYSFLETLYKEEHAHVLSLSDEKSQLQIELDAKTKKLEEAEKRIRELESSAVAPHQQQQQQQFGNSTAEAEQRIRNLEIAMAREKLTHNDLLTKLGRGRKRLEDLLVVKDNELTTVTQKLKEAEATNVRLNANLQQYTILIRTLANQNAQSRPPVQQQQQQQQ